MFESLAATLASAFSIWDHKEKNKYADKLIELRTKHREEINKDISVRSDAAIDNVEFELRLLAAAFSSGVGKQNT